MVMWAQRPNLIFLTICVEDCKEPEINVEPSKLFFKGVGGPDKKQHELTINFFGEIDKEVSGTIDLTVWKIHNLSITQISREINFG